MKDEIKALLYTVSMIAIMVLAVIFAQGMQSNDYIIGKQVGPWQGILTGEVRNYNHEYAIDAELIEGHSLMLTNQSPDMFDAPQGIPVKFWGTIESFRPLIIHVDGIGW